MIYETLNQRIKRLLSNDKTIDINNLYSNLSTRNFKLNLNDNNQLELYSETLKQSISVDFNSSIFKNKIDPKKAKLPTVKAIEGRISKPLNILDGTAGFGSDCFPLVSRGHIVTAIEKDPVIFLLLKDGLSRAALIADLSKATENLQLINANTENYLINCKKEFDVIYLDPMFPERKKSAKVKKNMQMLHEYLNESHTDEFQLFKSAKEKCKKLVIKRAILNDYFANEKPSISLKGKANRFDIYTTTKNKS